jgi:superfamily I DNA and/or RNA helicase
MLTVQYRMPPALCEVVSRAFYDELLTTADSKVAESGRLCDAKSITFKAVRGEASRREGSTSLYNEEEAIVATEVALDIEGKRPDWSVAILTFYKAQFKLIEDRLKDSRTVVTVLSVDAAQGQEFDVVILTAVVNGNRMSFLRDARRQCVAISRAKQQFVIVAHPDLCENMRVFGQLRAASDITGL